MKQLDTKVVLVTGAEGALGTAVAVALAEAGATVALVDHAPANGRDLPGALRLNGVDLGSPGEAAAAVERVIAACGRVDALVNVAGGFAWEPAASGSIETWDRMYRVNVRTAVIVSQAVLPGMLARGRGSIVNIGALAASQAGAGMAAYAASKSGVARLTEGLAEELKGKGVTVNALLPSVLDTPANRADMPEADPAAWVPLPDLAKVVVFLLSDDARQINGALVPVRGGM